MLTFPISEHPHKATRLWRIYLCLGLLQCLGIFLLGFMLQAGATKQGFSTAQLLTTSIAFLLMLALGYFFIETWLKPDRAAKRIEHILTFLQRRRNYWTVLLLSGAIFAGSAFLVTLTPELNEPFTLAIFRRLFLIFLLAAGLGFQTTIVLLLLRFGFGSFMPKQGNKLFIAVLIGMGIFFGMWISLARSIIPAASQVVGWNFLGPPLLELQVLFAWGAGMALLVLSDWKSRQDSLPAWMKRLKPGAYDLILCLLIWLAAVIVWQATPVHPNWFLTNPVEPNHESYPSSDARIYDMAAQSALVGNGYRLANDFNNRRPLLGMYFTLLHLIEGQRYDSMVSLQVLLLAVFPALVYLLTKALHTRASGVIAAALIIFREGNAIALSGNITTANAKILMSDLPTAVILAGFTCLAVLWLDREPGKMLPALIAGEVLGLAMLIRPETFVLIGAVGLALVVIFYKKPSYTLMVRQLAIFLLGIGLVLSPWVWRNWKLTGLIYLNEPTFRFGIINQRFVPLPTPTPPANNSLNLPGLPGSSTFQPVSLAWAQGGRQAAGAPTPTPQASLTPAPIPPPPAQPGNSAKQYILLALQNPWQTIRLAAAHFLNSEIQTILIFPSTFRMIDAVTGFVGHRSLDQLWFECCSSTNYIRRMPYWHNWAGEIPLQSILPLFINCLILAAGIQVAWNRRGWVGLVPLIGAMIYIASNAVFRNSGGRYILPVDWVAIVYFSIGLGQLSINLVSDITGSKILPGREILPGRKIQLDDPVPLETGKAKPKSLWISILLAAAFLMVAIMIPVIERSMPVRYPAEKTGQMLAAVINSDKLTPVERQGLQKFLQNGAVVTSGRILYPQYYMANIGSLGKQDSPIAPLPISHLVFNQAGSANHEFSLPVQKKPGEIPNASDGLVIACPGSDAIALAVFGPSSQLESVTLISPFPATAACLPPGGSSPKP